MSDTNLVAALMNALNALANKPAANPGQAYLIVIAIIALIAPLITAWVNNINSRTLSAKIDASKIVSDETSKTVASIKVDTNHDRVVMMEELRKLRESTTALATKNATLEEQKRSGEMTAAIAANPSPEPRHSEGVFSDSQLEQLIQALRGSKGPEPLTATLTGPLPLPVTVIKQ